MPKKIRVAVVFGGRSGEHEVSLVSAASVMKALDKKLVRDLWGMKGQFLAIAAVVASGVATFVMSLSTLGSLERNLTTYYDRYRFAQVFAQMKRAPNSR